MIYYIPNKDKFDDYYKFIRSMDHKEGDRYVIVDGGLSTCMFENTRTKKRNRYYPHRFKLFELRKSHLPKWW